MGTTVTGPLGTPLSIAAMISEAGAQGADASGFKVTAAGQAGAVGVTLAAGFGASLSLGSFAPYANGTTPDNVAFAKANAVSAAGGSRLIYVPEGTYAGDGTITGGVFDGILCGPGTIAPGTLTLQAVASDGLPTPFMFPGGVGPQHLTAFHTQCLTGAATVVLNGDSILAPGGNTVAASEYLSNFIMSCIRRHNPGVNVSLFNGALGGTTWLELATLSSPTPPWFPPGSSTQWLTAVGQQGGALQIISLGGNDGYGLSTVSVASVISTMLGWTPTPSIVLTTPVQLSKSNTTASSIEATDFACGWLRTYAERNGYGLLDWERWLRMVRDGFDRTHNVLTMVTPQTGTNLPSFGTAVATDSNGNWMFPAVQNAEGVYANACTDFSINFTLNQAPNAVIVIPLFPNGINGNTPYANDAYLVLNNSYGGFIGATWSDTVTQNLDATTTAIPLPTGAMTYQVTLKGGNLTISANINGVSDTSPPTGLGFVTIFDRKIVRFGSNFQPSISNIGTGKTITINNLAIGSSSQITANNRLVRPGSDNNSLTAISTWAGGNNLAHLNGYGRAKIYFPVIEQQDWRPPVAATPSTLSNITLTGTTTVTGQLNSGSSIIAVTLGAVYGSDQTFIGNISNYAIPSAVFQYINGTNYNINNPGSNTNPAWIWKQLASDGTVATTLIGSGTAMALDLAQNLVVGNTITGFTSLTLKGATSGSIALAVPATGGIYSLTLPSANGTLLSTAAAVTIAQGGTGQATQQAALNALAGGASTTGYGLRYSGSNWLAAQFAASDLSNGTTGTGSVMLAASPTTTGTLTAATVAASVNVTATGFMAAGASGSQIFAAAGTFTATGTYLLSSGGTSYTLNNPGAGTAGHSWKQLTSGGGNATTNLGSGLTMVLDISGDLSVAGYVSAYSAFKVNTVQVLGAPIAGYGTPTGNAYQASFAASTITLPNLAACVAQLIIDCKSHGFIKT